MPSLGGYCKLKKNNIMRKISFIITLLLCVTFLDVNAHKIQGQAYIEWDNNQIGSAGTLYCPNFGVCATMGCDNCSDPFNFSGDVWIDIPGWGKF